MRPPCAAIAIAALASACSSSRHDTPAVPSASASAAEAPDAGPSSRVVIDPVLSQGGCVMGHEGLVLDLGEKTSHADLAIHEATEAVERDGATWERVSQKTLTLRFAPPSEPLGASPSDGGKPEVYIDAKVRSVLAKSATVYLDGKAVGTWSLAKGETRVVSAHSSTASVGSGSNQLQIRFNGVPKASSNDAVAEIDWIRIGTAPAPTSYAPTTRLDAIVTQTVDGVAKRAVSLPAPGFLRCIGYLPKGATVSLSLAAAGHGDADVVVRVVRDRVPPKELGTFSGNDAAWKAVSLPIPDDLTDTIAAVEVSVPSASHAARALLGELRITAPPLAGPAPHAPARNAVLVVLGEAPPSQLGVYGGKTATPTLEALGKSGLVFEHHRATTTWAAGSFASALTGLLPLQHGDEDDSLVLSTEPLTIAKAARDAGIQPALFTANPTTSAPYGYDRDWVDFESLLPGADASTRVFDDAALWIGKHKEDRFLVVVHARGGHPPWDASAEDLKALPPDSYTGPIDPRHAAEILSRARRVPPQIRFGDPDRARAWALFDLAIKAHDAAIGKLVQALHDSGHEADTAVFVTGDVGVSPSAHVPFGDDGALDEATLAIPLIVRPPDGFALAGTRVPWPTSSIDLARSIVSMLGLSAPQGFGGADVMGLVVGAPDARPLAAFSPKGKLSLREGSLVISGTREKDSLCDLSIDEGCATDVSSTYPLAASQLRRQAASVFALPRVRSATFVPDAALISALRLWGR